MFGSHVDHKCTHTQKSMRKNKYLPGYMPEGPCRSLSCNKTNFQPGILDVLLLIFPLLSVSHLKKNYTVQQGWRWFPFMMECCIKKLHKHKNKYYLKYKQNSKCISTVYCVQYLCAWVFFRCLSFPYHPKTCMLKFIKDSRPWTCVCQSEWCVYDLSRVYSLTLAYVWDILVL